MSGKRNNNRSLISFLLLILVVGVFFYSLRFENGVKFNSPFSFIKSNPKISILVVGDMMLDRNVRNKINEVGFEKYFSGIKDLVTHADLAVANLEGPFTDSPSLTASLVNKTLTFTFDPALAPKLAELGFDLLGLANNHTLNFGQKGLESTKQYVREAGMFYYGDPDNRTEISFMTAKKGISVGFVGFHEFSYLNFEKVLKEVKDLRTQVDFLIVSPHWGAEYEKAPTTLMKNWAHKFIDAGADVVIGAHPHIVGEIEEYRGKKIYYSLGNFAFDQYFSEETMNGLAVLLTLEKDREGKIKVSDRLIPIRSDRSGTSIATSTP